MARILIDENGLWGLKLNVKETKYMAIGYISRYLQLEECKGIISHVNEYTYLGVRITKVGSHRPEINERFNKGRADVTKLNSILWDSDVTPKTRTHIYHATVKSTITYASETYCFNSKNSRENKFHKNGLLAKLSSKFQEG
jgi:hypothetical protein